MHLVHNNLTPGSNPYSFFYGGLSRPVTTCLSGAYATGFISQTDDVYQFPLYSVTSGYCYNTDTSSCSLTASRTEGATMRDKFINWVYTVSWADIWAERGYTPGLLKTVTVVLNVFNVCYMQTMSVIL